jgi:hypothetical protein
MKIILRTSQTKELARKRISSTQIWISQQAMQLSEIIIAVSSEVKSKLKIIDSQETSILKIRSLPLRKRNTNE